MQKQTARPTLSRSEFLRVTAMASTGWLASGLAARGQSTGGDRESRIARVIAEYDRQGIHRTATPVDNDSADWLARQARDAGADATLQPFTLDRVEVASAYLEAGGRRVDALPLFDGGFTDERGLSGRIGPPEANQAFALVKVSAAGIFGEGQQLADLRRSARFKGIVAVTRGAHAGLSPINAASFAKPFGPPVLQVSSEDDAWLDEQARQPRDVRLVARATRTSSRAHNVVATLAGRQSDLAPVVVITPRSGWWQCASERGGGIASWLEIIRAARNTTRRPMLFVASSGHELGHLGLDAFIESRPGLVRSAAAWIHLGANIGAAGGAARLQASDDQIEEIATRALAQANAPVKQRVPRGTVPDGEARNIHVGGGRYVSLLGSSPVFHNPADRWPTAVDAPAVARFATALADIAVTLASAS